MSLPPVILKRYTDNKAEGMLENKGSNKKQGKKVIHFGAGSTTGGF